MDLINDLTNQKEMNTVELLSEMALFSFIGGSEMGKDASMFLSGTKILCELYRRFTEKDRIIEALRLDATRKIVLYIHENPNASESAQVAEVKKHIDDFAVKVAFVQGAK